eukprot:Clim_evm180s157 gene=Clim_evmTU180s157
MRDIRKKIESRLRIQEEIDQQQTENLNLLKFKERNKGLRPGTGLTPQLLQHVRTIAEQQETIDFSIPEEMGNDGELQAEEDVLYGHLGTGQDSAEEAVDEEYHPEMKGTTDVQNWSLDKFGRRDKSGRRRTALAEQDPMDRSLVDPHYISPVVREAVDRGVQAVLNTGNILRSQGNTFDLEDNLPRLPRIGDILRVYGIGAVKHLSQNFIIDPSVMTKIAEKVVLPAHRLRGADILEVGPGPGNLTRALIRKRPANIWVVEKDSRFMPALHILADAASVYKKDGVDFRVIHDDILAYDYKDLGLKREIAPTMPMHAPRASKLFLASDGKGYDAVTDVSNLPMARTQVHVSGDSEHENWGNAPLMLFGNLPFNIASPLIVRLMKMLYYNAGPFAYGPVGGMSLVFQKEVGLRILAESGTKKRSRISILTQNLCEVRQGHVIKSTCFVPAPKVDALMVNLTPREKPLALSNITDLEFVTTVIFNQRRKQLSNGIKALFGDTVETNGFSRHKEKMGFEFVRKDKLKTDEVAALCHELSNRCGIDMTRRAEEMEVLEFDAVTQAFVSLIEDGSYKKDYTYRKELMALDERKPEKLGERVPVFVHSAAGSSVDPFIKPQESRKEITGNS